MKTNSPEPITKDETLQFAYDLARQNYGLDLSGLSPYELDELTDVVRFVRKLKST